MRVYIAGPMSGLDKHNYPAFMDAAKVLMAAGLVPVNPAGDRSGCDTWQDFMRASLHDIAGVDGVCVLEGWENSKGATLEVTIATNLELPVKTLAEWVGP